MEFFTKRVTVPQWALMQYGALSVTGTALAFNGYAGFGFGLLLLTGLVIAFNIRDAEE